MFKLKTRIAPDPYSEKELFKYILKKNYASSTASITTLPL